MEGSQQPPPPPPPQDQQQGQQQQSQQFYSDYRRPSAQSLVQNAYPPAASAGIGGLFKKGLIFGGILLGGLILFVAALIMIFTTDPDIFDVGQALRALGGMIMFFLAFGGGIMGTELDKVERAGLLIASGLFAAIII